MHASITLEYAQEGSLVQKMEVLQQAGFTAINLGTPDCRRFLSSSEKETASFREQMESMGLQLDWLHAPYHRPILFDPETEWFHLSMGAMKTAIRIAAELGAGSIIVHPFNIDFPQNIHEEPAVSHLVDAFSILVECGREHGVSIAVENIDEPYSASILPTLFTWIEDLKFCFDAGHAELWKSWDDYLPRYADRLTALHIHDNHGSKDEHLIPGDGTINYQPLIDLLRSCGYQGFFGLECAQKISSYPGGYEDLALSIHKRITGLLG